MYIISVTKFSSAHFAFKSNLRPKYSSISSILSSVVNFFGFETRSVFDIGSYSCDYDEFQLFVNGIDAREYRFYV